MGANAFTPLSELNIDVTPREDRPKEITPMISKCDPIPKTNVDTCDPSPKTTSIICDVCNVTCKNQDEYDTHLTRAFHKSYI